jgi:hypothetical protein
VYECAHGQWQGLTLHLGCYWLCAWQSGKMLGCLAWVISWSSVSVHAPPFMSRALEPTSCVVALAFGMHGSMMCFRWRAASCVRPPESLAVAK